MGSKFRRKVAAGQNKKAVGSLTNDLRQLAGFVRMNAMAQQAVVKALIEHLGCEKEVRAIVQKYEDEMRKAAEQKAPAVTADRRFNLRYTQPIDHEHTWDMCGFDESEADHMGHCDHGLHGCDCAVCRAKYAEVTEQPNT